MSFHVAPTPTVPFFNYTHSKITTQLSEQGVHAIELRFRVVGGDFIVSMTPGIDGQSNCPNLTRCMQSAHNFTITNNGHWPLFLIIEAADDSSKFNKWTWDWLDNAIAAIWPRYLFVYHCYFFLSPYDIGLTKSSSSIKKQHSKT